MKRFGIPTFTHDTFNGIEPWEGERYRKVVPLDYVKDLVSLCKTYEQYLKLVGEEINELIPYAAPHMWKTTRFEAGEKFRKKISKLKEKLQ
jgi:hypothetical protein